MGHLGTGEPDESWRIPTSNYDESEYYCYSCNEGLIGDELEWYNDTPVCPHCQNEIEL